MFKEKSKVFCEPYRSAAEWIPPDSRCNVDQLKYWAPKPWPNSHGRVTLAGDAAHAVLPCKCPALFPIPGSWIAVVADTRTNRDAPKVRAQGFNVSLEDALQLVNAITQIRDGADRVETIQEYDKDVCRRGHEAVMQSLEEGKKKMNVESLMTSKTATQGFAKESSRI